MNYNLQVLPDGRSIETSWQWSKRCLRLRARLIGWGGWVVEGLRQDHPASSATAVTEFTVAWQHLTGLRTDRPLFNNLCGEAAARRDVERHRLEIWLQPRG